MSQSATILVIDDEPQIRKFLRISLVSQGYTVLEAATGADGLSQAALGRPDVLVLDLGLPDMDGQQVLREFREWSNAPVLVLSVRASEAQKVQALDGGANDYVTKPFGIQEFLARIRALLRQAPVGETRESALELGPLTVDLAFRLEGLTFPHPGTVGTITFTSATPGEGPPITFSVLRSNTSDAPGYVTSPAG